MFSLYLFITTNCQTVGQRLPHTLARERQLQVQRQQPQVQRQQLQVQRQQLQTIYQVQHQHPVMQCHHCHRGGTGSRSPSRTRFYGAGSNFTPTSRLC